MSVITAPLPLAGPAAGVPARGRSAGRWILRALSTTVTVLVSMVAVLAIVLAVATRTSANGQFAAFGHPVMSMLSGSMTGVINTGDLIVDDPVTPAQAQHLHVGQIITVLEAPGSKSHITHRIVAVKITDGVVSYITKGDANNAPDAMPRPASDVVGIFRFDIPRGGYVLYALHQPKALGMLLGSVVFWFLIGPLFRMAGETDEPENENQNS
jgi:signal peptidase